MEDYVNAGSIKLKVLRDKRYSVIPESCFELPSGKWFGFPWTPMQLYAVGNWVVGLYLTFSPGRIHHIAHDNQSGGTCWTVEVDADVSFQMDADGKGFTANAASVRFDRQIWQILQLPNGYCVVLADPHLKTGQNIVLVGDDGAVRWTIHKPDGSRTATYFAVRLIDSDRIEASADRYLAIIDANTGQIALTRP